MYMVFLAKINISKRQCPASFLVFCCRTIFCVVRYKYTFFFVEKILGTNFIEANVWEIVSKFFDLTFTFWWYREKGVNVRPLVENNSLLLVSVIQFLCAPNNLNTIYTSNTARTVAKVALIELINIRLLGNAFSNYEKPVNILQPNA